MKKFVFWEIAAIVVTVGIYALGRTLEAADNIAFGAAFLALIAALAVLIAVHNGALLAAPPAVAVAVASIFIIVFTRAVAEAPFLVTSLSAIFATLAALIASIAVVGVLAAADELGIKIIHKWMPASLLIEAGTIFSTLYLLYLDHTVPGLGTAISGVGLLLLLACVYPKVGSKNSA